MSWPSTVTPSRRPLALEHAHDGFMGPLDNVHERFASAAVLQHAGHPLVHGAADPTDEHRGEGLELIRAPDRR